MYTPFERIMNTIRPHLPGAIDDAIKQELFNTCLDFFKRSLVWREEIDFTLRTDELNACLTPVMGRIDTLIGVKDADDNIVRGVIMPTPGNVQFRHAPQSDVRYTAVVSLTVTDPTSRESLPLVPFPIIERYMEELEHGVLARMMSQPSKPYTSVALATYHMSAFRGGAARAKNEMKTGHTFGSQAWHFPQSFSTVR